MTNENQPTNKSASPKENTYPVNTKIDPIQTSHYIRNMKTLFHAGQRFLVGEVTNHIFLEKWTGKKVKIKKMHSFIPVASHKRHLSPALIMPNISPQCPRGPMHLRKNSVAISRGPLRVGLTYNNLRRYWIFRIKSLLALFFRQEDIFLNILLCVTAVI